MSVRNREKTLWLLFHSETTVLLCGVSRSCTVAKHWPFRAGADELQMNNFALRLRPELADKLLLISFCPSASVPGTGINETTISGRLDKLPYLIRFHIKVNQ